MNLEGLESQLSDADWPTWLVYGDWLLSQGDVRGELIRLEHEHALAPRDNQRKRRLHNELRALTKTHEASWRAGLPEHLTVAWKHGFVTSVWLPWTEEAFAVLPAFLASANGRLLSTVAFEWRSLPERDAFLALLQRVSRWALPKVHTLSFAYVSLGREGAEVLAQSNALSSLRHLDLRYADLRDEGLSVLLERGALGAARQVSLQKNELTSRSAVQLAHAALPRLRELDLRFNAIGAEGAEALARAPFAASLERLFLNVDDVGLEGVRSLARSPSLPTALRRMWSAR